MATFPSRGEMQNIPQPQRGTEGSTDPGPRNVELDRQNLFSYRLHANVLHLVVGAVQAFVGFGVGERTTRTTTA